jgi:hypothetical protein
MSRMNSYDNDNENDNDNDKLIKSILKGKGLLPPVGLARLDSWGELLPMSLKSYSCHEVKHDSGGN